MDPVTSNFAINVGSDDPKSWGFSDSSGPLDLTGYEAELQIRASVETPGEPLLRVNTTTLGGLVISGGEVTFTPPSLARGVVLAGLPWGPLQVGQSAAGIREVVQGYLADYQLTLTPLSGAPIRFIEGRVAFRPEMSNV